jgi:hypothetical protein
MDINGLRMRSKSRLDNLILESVTDSPENSQSTTDKFRQEIPVPKVARYVPSSILFARIRVKGKRIPRSLKKTHRSVVAKPRLADLEKAVRLLSVCKILPLQARSSVITIWHTAHAHAEQHILSGMAWMPMQVRPGFRQMEPRGQTESAHAVEGGGNSEGASRRIGTS